MATERWATINWMLKIQKGLLIMKKKKKSIHELCKEFPNKSYRELEKYRDSDRWEEAIGIGHNHPPEDPDNDEYEWK